LKGDPHERWRAEAAELGIDADSTVAGYRAASRVERDVYDRPEFVVDGPRLALDGDMMDLLMAAAEDSATSLSDVDFDAVVYAAGNAGPGFRGIGRSGESIPEGGWVIADEAGQLSTRDLAALCGKGAAAGARVVLVGDPAQQGSVSAGGMFDALAASHVLPVFTLNQLWRFDDPAEAQATAEIHRGLKQGLDYHRDRGRITVGASGDAAAAAADWWEHHHDRTTLVSAPTVEMARQINAEIAERRAQTGETGAAVAGTGDRAIRVGDVVTTRQNDRHRRANDGLAVRNGDRWIAAATGQGDLVLEHLERQAQATVTAAYATKHVDLGYAITQTRA